MSEYANIFCYSALLLLLLLLSLLVFLSTPNFLTAFHVCFHSKDVCFSLEFWQSEPNANR